MHAMVMYDTEFGNTAWIAKAMGQALEEAFAVRVQSAQTGPRFRPNWSCSSSAGRRKCTGQVRRCGTS